MISYVSVEELRSSIGSAASDINPDLERIVLAASRAIEDATGRYFYDHDDAPAQRLLRARSPHILRTGDFWTTVGLIVAIDTRADGSFATTWGANDVQPEPVNPKPGWPWTAITALGPDFPTTGRRAMVRVTARWGWEAVPSQVAEAAMLIAARLWDRRSSSSGVLGIGPEGFAVRIARDDPDVRRLLEPLSVISPLVG